MPKLKAMYPAPVYVATLDDGRTVRMTVWQDKNAPEKGYDWEGCRRTIMMSPDSLGEPVPAYVVGRNEKNGDPQGSAWASMCETDREHDPRLGLSRAWNDFVTVMQQQSFAQSGRKIVAAHLEQAGAILSRDPEFHADAACLGRDFAKRKKAAVPPKRLRQWLDSIINAPAEHRDSIIGGIAARLGLAEGMAGAD